MTMDSNDKVRQWIKNQHPDQYRRLLEIVQDNMEAMLEPKDTVTVRLEALGFHRHAITALSDTHYFSTPCDKKGEYNLVYQRGDGVYSKWGEKSITYDPGIDVWKSCGRILKEGFYTLDEFDLVLDKMERSHWYREKRDKKRLPVLSVLQRSVYDSLPMMFTWSQGKEVAIRAGMPSRTAQRFFGNTILFQKVKNGSYAKRIVFTGM